MSRLRLLFPLDLQYFNEEKTEQPTSKKIDDARKKGQVAKSSDLSPAVTLTTIFLLLSFFGSFMYETFLHIMRESITTYLTWEVNQENLGRMSYQLMYESAKIVAPVWAIGLVIALVTNYLQVGWLFTTEPLMMKLEKLDPIAGAKRLFALRSLVELAKSLLKITACAFVAYKILWNAKEELLKLSFVSIDMVVRFAADEVIKLGLYIGLLLLILASLDYAYQKYEYTKSLRMSKKDLKDEHKNAEGDPLIKSKIRERQRSMAIRRMMQELPKADVIITNPTHFAVAVKYETGTMSAPTVIAKGQDYMALKIREAAKKHRIVTMENKPLARALYSQVEIGQQIPEELFKAVAEVLAYVYKLQGKIK